MEIKGRSAFCLPYSDLCFGDAYDEVILALTDLVPFSIDGPIIFGLLLNACFV